MGFIKDFEIGFIEKSIDRFEPGPTIRGNMASENKACVHVINRDHMFNAFVREIVSFQRTEIDIEIVRGAQQTPTEITFEKRHFDLDKPESSPREGNFSGSPEGLSVIELAKVILAIRGAARDVRNYDQKAYLG